MPPKGQKLQSAYWPRRKAFPERPRKTWSSWNTSQAKPHPTVFSTFQHRVGSPAFVDDQLDEVLQVLLVPEQQEVTTFRGQPTCGCTSSKHDVLQAHDITIRPRRSCRPETAGRIDFFMPRDLRCSSTDSLYWYYWYYCSRTTAGFFIPRQLRS